MSGFIEVIVYFAQEQLSKTMATRKRQFETGSTKALTASLRHLKPCRHNVAAIG